MNNILLYVFLGGGMGAVMRYMLGTYITSHYTTDFPYATFAVNCIGGLLIGMAAAYFMQHAHAPLWRAFIITGILGGFTTFSAFGLETVQLLEKGMVATALIYALSSVIAVILLVIIGAALVQNS
jgi:fluoride exporter